MEGRVRAPAQGPFHEDPRALPSILHAVFQCRFRVVGARVGGMGGGTGAKLRALAGLWGVVSYASSYGMARRMTETMHSCVIEVDPRALDPE